VNKGISNPGQACRLLYVVGQLRPGGLERQLHLLLQGMDRERYLPAVVVWSFREEEIYVRLIRDLGISLYPIDPGMSPFAKLIAFRHLVAQIKPEVVHSYSFHTNLPAWSATLGTSALAIGAVRSSLECEKSCGLMLGILSARWPRTQIYNNLAAAQTARNHGGLFVPRRISVVRNGIDLKQFQKFPLTSNGRARILGIGSLFELKRWDRLLKAALDLKTMGLDFEVEIVGGGPLRDSLQQLAQDLGVMDVVKFTGHADDVPSLLASSTFLVHTSDIEGCPNVVMEAMACARAVVATNVGDIPLIVDNGKTGFIVGCADHAQLVECLATLIANRDLCNKMGEAGRTKAEQEFGMARLVQETFDAYKQAGWTG